MPALYHDILDRSDDMKVPTSYLLLNQYNGKNDEQILARDMEVIAKIARYRTDNETYRYYIWKLLQVFCYINFVLRDKFLRGSELPLLSLLRIFRR